MALTFTSWSFDAASYAPGATITLTVKFASADDAAASDVVNAVTAVLTDSTGTATQTSDASGNFPSFTVEAPSNAPEPVTATATDTSGITWTPGEVTFAGTTSPFAGMVIFTAVAV